MNFSYCFKFCCFANIGTQTLGRSIFFWVTSGFPLIPLMMSLKGQIKYLCATGCFEKRMKAEFSNVSYMLFLPELSILEVEYF